ncbi:hypothetical protein Bca4012_100236 [Brassica carinata]
MKKNVSSRKSYGGNLVKGSVKDETNDCSSDGYVKKEVKPENVEFEGGFDTGTNEFRTVCNVERVVPESIIVLVKLLAAGDRHGNVGFWNLDCEGL